MAIEHLFSFGHKRIGMIAGKFSISDKSHHRWHGYRKCLRNYGIAYDPSLVLQCDYGLEEGKLSVWRLMKLPDPPTAVFCSNDFLAIAAIQGARQMGLDVPKDLSVVGFDNMPMAGFLNPALTTVSQPAYYMGVSGAELLLERIENPYAKPVQKLLDLHMIHRGSVSEPRQIDPNIKRISGVYSDYQN
jgi:DNA-binding LacI/PurR family transcriptional regulator